MIFSDWVTVGDLSTVRDTHRRQQSEIRGHAGPELTADLLNTGVVLVYMRLSTGTWQLPYTSDAGGKPNTVDFFAKPGEIIITRFAFDDSGSVNFSSAIEFRYVIIPGGVPAGANIADYATLQAIFGIPD